MMLAGVNMTTGMKPRKASMVRMKTMPVKSRSMIGCGFFTLLSWWICSVPCLMYSPCHRQDLYKI